MDWRLCSRLIGHAAWIVVMMCGWLFDACALQTLCQMSKQSKEPLLVDRFGTCLSFGEQDDPSNRWLEMGVNPNLLGKMLGMFCSCVVEKFAVKVALFGGNDWLLAH
eukprot:2692898-Amphidinium_carterae.2